MDAKILARDRLGAWLQNLLQEHQVIAPTGAEEVEYQPIDAADDLNLTVDRPRQTLKRYFFPQRDTLFSFQVKNDQIALGSAEGDEEKPSQVIIARPCDAAALPILDKVFYWDYQDAQYRERRSRTTVIGLACAEPCASCFCTSVGGSPAGTAGADLLLTPMGDVYHVQVLTEHGQALIDASSELFTDSTPELDEAQTELEQEYCERIERHVETQALAEQLDFDSPIWENITEQCIDCCVCTFLCPTCHCFDIQDEGEPIAGERVRLWDSCATRLFTRTAVHQPRATHASRYRQRIMHKFQYYPENFGEILCVGCGRCIEHCPTGVDITQVLQTVAVQGPEESEHD